MHEVRAQVRGGAPLCLFHLDHQDKLPPKHGMKLIGPPSYPQICCSLASEPLHRGKMSVTTQEMLTPDLSPATVPCHHHHQLGFNTRKHQLLQWTNCLIPPDAPSACLFPLETGKAWGPVLMPNSSASQKEEKTYAQMRPLTSDAHHQCLSPEIVSSHQHHQLGLNNRKAPAPPVDKSPRPARRTRNG